MALDLDVRSLKAQLQQTRSRWNADITPLSHLTEDQKLLRLGAVPPPKLASLQHREKNSKDKLRAFSSAAAPPAYPPSHDWRNVAGANYVTPIRDQSACGSCVAFGTLAAVESNYRVQTHDPQSQIDLSEAQLFYCHARSEGRTCSGPTGGWWPDRALSFMSNPGVADENCYPYFPGDQNCTNLCGDWQSRATSITGYHSITDIAAMKSWLSTKGPLITCFSVYDDFFSYRSGVYHQASGNLAGGHCVCVVGYDDRAQCWICKNSWGSAWGDSGFFRIGYGECGIDYEMWAIEGVRPRNNKVTLNDTAIGAPALANMDGQSLALAWAGTDSAHHLNVLLSRDGAYWASKIILPETSFDGPALAWGSGRLLLGWVGQDPGHHLNFLSSPDGQTFGNKATIPETSRFAPALAFGNGRFYVAWIGNDPNMSLNVMSSSDGQHWAGKVTLAESSDSAPGLCFASGNLYLVWQGRDSGSHLNVIESSDGVHFANKQTLLDSSDFRPALIGDGQLLLAWTGRDSNHHLNSMRSPGPTNAFGSKVSYADTSSNGPALARFAGSDWIAWTGTDSVQHLNVMRL